MESPVVLDKPPEYHGNDRGFPFDDEEASGAWSELAARHPDIAARLRQRPASATWARKRRPSSQDATDDFGENFSGFDRFPFDDIPPEFREHFPSHWNRRFGSREEAPPQPPPSASPPQPSQPPQTPQPPQQTAATQTDTHTQTEPQADPAHSLPQYGLRNTVDLGQKSPAVDGPERAPRSMSAPPEPRPPRDMSAPPPEPANVRHIPIFVEGRDEPVISRGEPAPAAPHASHAPHAPHAPHIDRDAYFADDTPSFHPPPNFTRAFGTPSGKPFRPGPQPFMQQKVYPQAGYRRAPSPQRDRSPRPPHPAAQPPPPPPPPTHEVPVHHQQAAPPRAPAPPPQREATPPHVPPKPAVNDPITQILSIQTDVLNLMTEVENFTGTKKDKRYLFLDEMLTRNLIKLDNIETEGKENIRLARKEAIRCIQKCIAVLEAKAEKNGNPALAPAPADDVPMSTDEAPANGELDMKADATDPQTTDPESAEESTPPTEPLPQQEPAPPESVATPADAPAQEHKPSEEEQTKEVENKPSPKKKVVKKRDKSIDKAAADSAEAKDSDKIENVEVMQVDNKGDNAEQVMEVDGAASQ